MSFGRVVLACALSCSAACALSTRTPPDGSERPTLEAQFVVPRPENPDPPGVRFGGLSGLASLRDGRELLAVADDRERPRLFRLSISSGRDGFRVSPAGVIYLEQAAGVPAALDAEAIAVTPDGHIFIASEGFGNEEPRSPPVILEYSSDGRFLKQVQIRSRYAPDERGPQVRGVRDNAGFESLTVTPDGSRMFTASELPLMQDGEADSFAPNTRTRLLEYVNVAGVFEPRREFVYELEPMSRPEFDVRFAITGIVELLSLGGDELLAMERGFVESTDRTRALNRILLYRISVEGATDVSRLESLRGATGLVPARKTLVADLNQLRGLAPPLTLLDNFEGMAWGPVLPGGTPSLILVSDDNYSTRQVTAFLLLRFPGVHGRLH